MRGCDFYFFSKKDLLLDKLKKMNCFIYIFAIKFSDIFFFIDVQTGAESTAYIPSTLYSNTNFNILNIYITTYFPALEKYEKDIENTDGVMD